MHAAMTFQKLLNPFGLLGREVIGNDVDLFAAGLVHVDVGELEKTNPIGAIEKMRTLAEKGSVNSMLQLGWIYQKGIGTATDLKQAERWYRGAVEKGSKQATHHLGTIYWKQKDYAKAHEAFSIGESMDWAPAIYWLGRLYRDGLGVNKQPDKARLLFEQASVLGNLLATNALARMFMSGQFGFLNIFKGLHLFLRARKEVVAACMKDELDDRVRH